MKDLRGITFSCRTFTQTFTKYIMTGNQLNPWHQANPLELSGLHSALHDGKVLHVYAIYYFHALHTCQLPTIVIQIGLRLHGSEVR